VFTWLILCTLVYFLSYLAGCVRFRFVELYRAPEVVFVYENSLTFDICDFFCFSLHYHLSLISIYFFTVPCVGKEINFFRFFYLWSHSALSLSRHRFVFPCSLHICFDDINDSEKCELRLWGLRVSLQHERKIKFPSEVCIFCNTVLWDNGARRKGGALNIPRFPIWTSDANKLQASQWQMLYKQAAKAVFKSCGDVLHDVVIVLSNFPRLESFNWKRTLLDRSLWRKYFLLT
jgi:hypothetical protein